MTALIFDCDGVLADTERFGHLPAFNATFREFGLPVQWTESEYGELLRIGGGKERMASLLTPEPAILIPGVMKPSEQMLREDSRIRAARTKKRYGE